MAIRIVLADDSFLLREGITRLIATQSGLELVAVCDHLDSLMDAVADLDFDVLLTDIRMPPTGTDEGIRVAEHLRRVKPDVGVVVLSHYSDPGYALRLLEHGSHGRAYLLKERVADLDQLVHAVRETVCGRSVIDPRVVDELVAERLRRGESPLWRLTPREHDVMVQMAQGKNNAGIVAALSLSERAVEKHINAIFTKLGLSEEQDVNRRVKAVLMFLNAKEQVLPPKGQRPGHR